MVMKDLFAIENSADDDDRSVANLKKAFAANKAVVENSPTASDGNVADAEGRR